MFSYVYNLRQKDLRNVTSYRYQGREKHILESKEKHLSIKSVENIHTYNMLKEKERESEK